jgi:hypothetical protein
VAAAAAVQRTGLCKKNKEKTAAEVTNMVVHSPLDKDKELFAVGILSVHLRDRGFGINFT